MRPMHKRCARLAEYRQRRGYTIEELAQRAGLRPQTVERAEARQPVRWATVNALANALAVLPQVLLGGPDVWEDDGSRDYRSWDEIVAAELRDPQVRSPRFM